MESQTVFPYRAGNLWGFIDQSGAVTVPPQYDLIEPFSEGFAAVFVGGKRAFVDDKGTIRFRVDADDVKEFTDGRAAIKVRGRWGFVDNRGQIVVPPIYDFVLPFSEELAAVRRNGEYWYLDLFGQELVQPHGKGWDRSSIASFHEGRAQIRSSDRKFGYIDKSGDWVIAPAFDRAEPLVTAWQQST